MHSYQTPSKTEPQDIVYLLVLHQFVVLAAVGEAGMHSYQTSSKTEPQDIVYLDYYFRSAAIDSHLGKSRCHLCS